MIHDKLTGNDGANVIDGRGGDDEISGEGGNDTLIGGSGSDILTGGGGDDTFVISGRDTITDFIPMPEDKLDLGGGSRSVLSLNYMVDENDNNKLVINSGSHQVTFDNYHRHHRNRYPDCRKQLHLQPGRLCQTDRQ